MRYETSISIIMVGGHNAASLDASINSILDQTFSDFELILFVKKSIADSCQMIRSNDVRIKSQSNFQNLSTYATINIGLRMAKGKYACIIDSNAVSLPDRLKMQWEYMEKHPMAGAVGTSSRIIKGRSNGILYRYFSYPMIKARLLKSNCFDESSLMFRTKFLRDYNLTYDVGVGYAGSYDFIIRLANYCPVLSINRAVVKPAVDNTKVAFDKLQEERMAVNHVRLRQLSQFDLSVSRRELNLHFKLMQADYLEDSELQLAIDWLNKLLDRNEKLQIYTPKALFDFFQEILIYAIKQNSLGGWSVEKELIKFIKDTIPLGKTIVEFGSGVGTDALLSGYNVVSIEHDINYVYRHAINHICFYCPLEDGWYNRDNVLTALRSGADLILIDGPPREFRQGILNSLDLFKDVNVPIIFDDVDRDQQIILAFCTALKYSYAITEGAKKRFAYCTKLPE